LARLAAQVAMIDLVRAEELLVQVKTMREALNLIASADALRVFMWQANLGLANRNRATAIAIRARRKAGEIARNRP
jgi:hypothetical protein